MFETLARENIKYNFKNIDYDIEVKISAHVASDVVATSHVGLILVETSQTMLRRHHDVATGTSIRQTYLRRLCAVSLVRKWNRPIWDVVAMYQLVPMWDWSA